MTLHLNSPLFDPIRIAPRLAPKQLAEQMCRNAGYDPDDVRLPSRAGPHARQELAILRHNIAAAMIRADATEGQLLAWFDGFAIDTIRRWARDAKRGGQGNA